MKQCVKTIVTNLILVFLVLSMLTGCGKSEADFIADEKSETGNAGMLDYDSDMETNTTTTEGTDVTVKENRKIIENVSLNVETRAFDELLDNLNAEVSRVGGYIEKSSVTGNGFESKKNRFAYLTVRVPAEQSADFANFVSEHSTVTRKEITTDDVTLSYVDMESRVSALETEKATLERLLAEATSMEDVISIQDRMTDVIYEIESYKSQLRAYDNLIDYTTITLRIDEVERVAVVGEQTVWQEIGTNLKNGFKDVGQGCVRFFVFIISSIPYILIIAAYSVVLIGAIVICKKWIKKRNKTKKDTKE